MRMAPRDRVSNKRNSKTDLLQSNCASIVVEAPGGARFRRPITHCSVELFPIACRPAEPAEIYVLILYPSFPRELAVSTLKQIQSNLTPPERRVARTMSR